MTTKGRLAAKTIVITGAGRGLGLAMATSCIAEGASVIAVDRDAARLDAAAAALGETDGALTTAACDITDEAQVAALFDDLDTAPGG